MRTELQQYDGIINIDPSLLSLNTGNTDHFQQLVQDLPAAIYTCDTKGYITFYNQAAEKLWGRKPEIGKDLWCGSWRIFTPEGTHLPLDSCPMAIALKEKRPVYGEEILIERPDGQRRNVLPYPKPIFDDTGNLTGAINMLVDITPQKRNEQALRESEARFRMIADTAPVMIWMSNKNKLCNFFNKRWLEFTGHNLEDELDTGWIKGIHPEDLEKYHQVTNAAFDKKEDYFLEYRLLRRDGEYRWISDRGIPRFTPDNEFEGYTGSCVDSHDLKIFTNELEDLVDERTKDLKDVNTALRRSNEELEQFAYVASHDLQEPLRKIRIFSDRVMERNQPFLDEISKSYLSRVISASDRMGALILDVLNYSRLIHLTEQFEKTDLNHVIRHVINDLEIQIEHKNAEITIDELPVITAIPRHMNQLFQNILSNALKFTKEGIPPVITVSSRLVSESDEGIRSTVNQPCYEIVIEDNGIGFKKEFAESIFMIFHRLNDQQKYEGTGIGLALCRRIVNIHHGEIFAESEENAGTRMHIILPANQ